MPKREMVIQLVVGESPDQARPARGTRRAREFANLVPSDPKGAERNRMVTMDGAEMLTQKYLQRCPILGAVGNILEYPGPIVADWLGDEDNWLGYEDNTQTASGVRPAYNPDEMSDPNSATFLMFDFPEVQGNVFANVNNGDGRYFPLGAQAGLQGLVASVYNELWGGEQKIPAGGISLSGAAEIGGYRGG